MIRFCILWFAFFNGAALFGQGQILFANRVDAPVTIFDGNRSVGLGPDYSAQLFFVGTGGAYTGLLPTSTFPASTSSSDASDRYWIPQTIDVSFLNPGASATFVVRVWQIRSGSYENAIPLRAESKPFEATIGGGDLPPGALTQLQPFAIVVPEPASMLLSFPAIFLAFRWMSKHRV